VAINAYLELLHSTADPTFHLMFLWAKKIENEKDEKNEESEASSDDRSVDDSTDDGDDVVPPKPRSASNNH